MAIVWATLAICSGVASTSPWPIAETPRSTSSPISLRDRRFRRFDFADDLRRVEGRRRVEAEALGGFDQFVVADLRAERSEDGVAGLGEGLAEGAAAVLAVGVVDEAAADVDPVGDFEFVVERDDVVLQGGGGGDDLEGRARGLGGGEGLAGEGADVAVAGVEHGDAAGAAGQRRDRGFLQRRGRSSSSPAPPASASDSARTRPSAPPLRSTASSLPPGLPARRALKALLEAADPDRGFRREALRAPAVGSSSSGASPTSPVTSIAALPSGCSRSSAGAFGQRRRRRRRGSAPAAPARSRLRGARRVRRPGKTRLGSQAIAAFGEGQVELVFEPAEGDGGDRAAAPAPRSSPSRELGVLGGAGDEAAQGRDLSRLRGRRAAKSLRADRRLRGVVQLPVHRREVVRRPGFGEAVGGFLLGRAGGADGGADDEGDERDEGRAGACG